MSTPTRRTLDTLFDYFEAGQAAGSITPDRVQDLVQSLIPGFARISSNGESNATSITEANQWTKIDLTTTLAANARGMTMPQSNRILCGCPVPAIGIIDATVSVTSSPNQTFEVGIAKNGEIETESVERVKVGSGGDSVSVSCHADFEQSDGDYIELWIRNTTGTANPTVSGLYLRSVAWVL